MSEPSVRLSILDLSPVSTGSSPAQALRNTVDLAQRAEEYGYHRYWLAEHHFTNGVASSAPAVLIGLVAAATRRIRVGSGAVQLGHQTAATVVEQFGTVDALYPDRIDLGVGRSGQRREEAVAAVNGRAVEPSIAPTQRPVPTSRVVNGLLVPPPFDYNQLLASPRSALFAELLRQPGATPADFTGQVDDILAFIAGTYRSGDGLTAHVTPGEGAALQIWILGSSGGESARVAGERGLPFAANYHVSPGTVLEAVEAYRSAFRPSERLANPLVMVSADVVVAPDRATARELAAPYGVWVRSIRSGDGAIPYPTAEQAARFRWSERDRQLVADRLQTQFVGEPAEVADQLRVLRDATDADELLVTTITHEHADRVRSFELLAAQWAAS